MKKKNLIISLISLLILGLVVCIVLPPYAQSYFYYPTKELSRHTPKEYGLDFEVVNFASKDSTILNGWFIPALEVDQTHNASNAKGTVIQVHGNAGNISDHWFFMDWLPAQGYNVFVFDYRGYGHSEGKPTPKGLFEDTQSAIRYVRNRPDVDSRKLLILGQSLGGNNAIAAVGAGERAGICGMVLDSTFFSYSSIANEKLSNAGILMNDDYSAKRYIAALVPIPLLFIHGTADHVIPYEHSQRLYELATSPKELIIIPNGEHITALLMRAYGDTYQKQVLAFFESSLNSCVTPHGNETM